jgi:hypothetical protein
LRLTEAQLTQPDRIDKIAGELGFAEPQPGQIIRPSALPDASTPILAQATPPAFAVRSSF